MEIYLFYTFISAALFMAGPVNGDSHWTYPNLEENEEFPKWGGVCDAGKRQSPIDLSRWGSFKSDYGEVMLHNYDRKLNNIEMVNNGHTVELSHLPDHLIKLRGGPLKSDYILIGVHLHWWSEHTIDNIRYPLEIHFVHRNEHYADTDEAVKHKDGLAVLGVPFHGSNIQNEGIAEILEHFDEIKSSDKLNHPVKIKEFSLKKLLPHLEDYFTYPGSLTTPPCAESVIWIVSQKSFPITFDQVEKFKQLEIEKDRKLQSNYRVIQKPFDRAIVMVSISKNIGYRLQASLGVMLLMMIVKFLL